MLSAHTDVSEADISSGSNKVKQKLLNATAGLQAREVLNDLFIESHGITINDIPALSEIAKCYKRNYQKSGSSTHVDDYMQGSVSDPPTAL